MLFLSSFSFPCRDQEQTFFMCQKYTCYDSFYPFGVIDRQSTTRLSFEPVTILYGNNGSGKTTALNVIAEKLKLQRDSLYNRSNFFEDYTALCGYELARSLPEESRIITSDDVFDFMLNLRTINQGVDARREDLFQDYLDSKYAKFQLSSLEDYEQLKKVNTARRTSQSRYVRENLMGNIREHSNGENAYRYFTEKIQEQGLYLLDEPENSLSPERQLELCQFLEDSARFFGCQFIISTHSPFLLAMKGAKIYDMDERLIAEKRWTDLKNVRAYYDFFQAHQHEF